MMVANLCDTDGMAQSDGVVREKTRRQKLLAKTQNFFRVCNFLLATLKFHTSFRAFRNFLLAM